MESRLGLCSEAMALALAVLASPQPWRTFGEERRTPLSLPLRRRGEFLAGEGLGGSLLVAGARLRRRGLHGWARLKVVEAPVAESGQRVGNLVEIPVSCYQILGVPEQAEKDEIVKAAMELKCSEIEDGYTSDVIVSRQNLLIDVRDKLLFEPEYAGNVREKVSPKESLCIPWAWFPAALCLLQEAGQEKFVLEIGRDALQKQDVKPYIHDVLLSMALAQCSIAKAGFEKNKVSEGFEALARAQYLLRSKISLGKMPLLSQIEESLEELAPVCTLELLGVPHTPDNVERRRGAIAALRELIRQGLEVETSCRVKDWPCFLGQAMSKLMATEIVDLISWDNLAIARKNKKSLESQNQRTVIDFNCFYMVMIAHIALGFSTRQADMIAKAKTICECLIASEGVDLKFEEAFCSILLGQGGEAVAVEKLKQLEVNGNPALRNSESTIPSKEVKGKGSLHQLLETWLKDAVLCLFLDTRDCSPSLANFFGGPKRVLNGSKQNLGTSKPVPPVIHRSVSRGLSHELGTSSEQPSTNSTRHLGEAVKQLAPVNLQNHLTVGKATGSTSGSSVQLKRNTGLHDNRILESWSLMGDLEKKISYAVVAGCFIFSISKFLCMPIGHTRIPHKWQCSHPKMSTNAINLSMNQSPHPGNSSMDRSIQGQLGNLLVMFRRQLKHQTSAENKENTWPTDDFPAFTEASSGTVLHKSQMPLEEAEALVRQWQDIKAEALGPDRQIQTLSAILAESMLSKWQDLANSAKAKACFWRFVLLQLSILRADIILDEVGNVVAEIEAILEEAAELVDDSQQRKPSYYSTYKVQYLLKKQDDGSWRFCRGGIQTPV